MKNLKNQALAIWNDESAQGATEYILLLVAIVALVGIFKDKIKSAFENKAGSVGQEINDFTGK